MKGEYSDRKLIERIKCRDNNSFEYLLNKSYHAVSAFVQKNGGSADDVQDLLQDSLVILYENIVKDTFRENSDLLTYFYSIARNNWLNYFNRRKSRNVSIENYSGFSDSLIEEENTHDEVDNVNYIAALLSSSTDRCKKILLAYYYDNHSMSEIAGLLGYTNAANAKSQKAKCMDKLRTAFKNQKSISERNDIGKRQ